jgi:hypothetical protein
MSQSLQKHSDRETHNSSSPSPTRKHRISGREELKGEMNKIKPPTFDGEHRKEEGCRYMVAGHEEILPAAELFCPCRGNNCNVLAERKSVHVVGSVCAGTTHQRERGHVEGV